MLWLWKMIMWRGYTEIWTVQRGNSTARWADSPTWPASCWCWPGRCRTSLASAASATAARARACWDSVMALPLQRLLWGNLQDLTHQVVDYIGFWNHLLYKQKKNRQNNAQNRWDPSEIRTIIPFWHFSLTYFSRRLRKESCQRISNSHWLRRACWKSIGLYIGIIRGSSGRESLKSRIDSLWNRLFLNL